MYSRLTAHNKAAQQGAPPDRSTAVRFSVSRAWPLDFNRKKHGSKIRPIYQTLSPLGDTLTCNPLKSVSQTSYRWSLGFSFSTAVLVNFIFISSLYSWGDDRVTVIVYRLDCQWTTENNEKLLCN